VVFVSPIDLGLRGRVLEARTVTLALNYRHNTHSANIGNGHQQLVAYRIGLLRFAWARPYSGFQQLTVHFHSVEQRTFVTNWRPKGTGLSLS